MKRTVAKQLKMLASLVIELESELNLILLVVADLNKALVAVDMN